MADAPPSRLPDALLAAMQITMIRAPFAPGLFVAFGVWQGAGQGFPTPVAPLATGKGLTQARALAGCGGEMAENLSIGVSAHASPVRAAGVAGSLAGAPDARARDLSRADDPGSEGCAAHPDPDQARCRAFWERIERAALAAWWQGDLVAWRLPLPDLHPYRQGNPARRTALWRLDVVPGLPAVLAVSDDGQGGAPVMGTAAAADGRSAVHAALCEVMLAELALLSPPGHPDRPRMARIADGLGARAQALNTAPAAPSDWPIPADPVAHLRAQGHPVGFADLSCAAVGVPVFRCICPGLPVARPLGL